MITIKDIVRLDNVTLTNDEIDVLKKISSNTSNTWQSNRTPEEKLKDTLLGKFAEKGLALLFNYSKTHTPMISFYDEFRIDDYKKHNGVDFIFEEHRENGIILAKDNTSIVRVQDYLNKIYASKNGYYSLSDKERDNLRSINVSIGEIKSTRIGSRHLMTDGSVNLTKIISDDFLTYPKHTRKSSTISNKNDYIEYVKKQTQLQELDEIIKAEQRNLTDWYFRVYVKEKDFNSCDLYIVGCLSGVYFANNFDVKKMSKQTKSEEAIYLSVPIRKGTPIKDFIKENLMFSENSNVGYQNLSQYGLKKQKNQQ
jgi:hypothetical protein